MELISRQAAIDALNGKFTITGRENAETIRNYIDGVNKRLRELPSAERRGRWIFGGEEGWPKWTCSVCGGDGRGDYKICPWCGAKMDEVEE